MVGVNKVKVIAVCMDSYVMIRYQLSGIFILVTLNRGQNQEKLRDKIMMSLYDVTLTV